MSDNSMYDNLRKNEQRKKAKGSFASLFFFYIIPFILINTGIFFFATALPDFEITASEPIDYKTVDIVISKKSFLPIKSISAKLEADDLPLEKISDNVYHATVQSNGNLEVDVVGINTMEKSFFMYVDSLDFTAPVVEGEVINNNIVNVTFDDEASGIDFNSIYATDFVGNRVEPKNLDKEHHTASFNFNTASLTVYISDMAGNTVTAQFVNK